MSVWVFCLVVYIINNKTVERANFGAKFQLRLSKMQNPGLRLASGPQNQLRLQLRAIRNGATCFFFLELAPKLLCHLQL